MVRILCLAVLAAAAQAQVKIVVTGLGAGETGQLRAAAPAGVSIVAAAPATLPAEIADADGVIGAVSPQLFAAAKKLRWIQTHSAGVDGMSYPELTRSGVILTNAKIVMGPNIADHAFALLLAMTRGTNRAAAGKAAEEWNREQYGGLIELTGKTAVIVGAGGIGMQIAQRAKGFGMTVVGVDPKDIPYTPLLDETVKPDRLDEVLGRADAVFLTAPLTPESRGMIGPRQFELMKKGAYFIAVSRGPVYQTPALVKALDSGHLGGAGLDVTDPEPLPKGHPLWKFGNVVITPHVAGQSDLMPKRRLELFKENIRRFAQGRPLLNVVDKQKGY
jgi:phosphoglycerate dehydrogenase-like enzyme